MEEIRGLLSIARKAGYVLIGKDTLSTYTKKLYLLLIDKNAGNSLLREMRFISQKRDLPLFELEGLGQMVAIENCKAIGIKNKAISDNIIKCIKGE